mmetsp:Transcript_46384/g.123221  ORF Transcript_46384/g.123221 Transcript_46384/m.123221 type:complete len:224 (-) Transcript_46384:443-1114(-)
MTFAKLSVPSIGFFRGASGASEVSCSKHTRTCMVPRCIRSLALRMGRSRVLAPRKVGSIASKSILLVARISHRILATKIRNLTTDPSTCEKAKSSFHAVFRSLFPTCVDAVRATKASLPSGKHLNIFTKDSRHHFAASDTGGNVACKIVTWTLVLFRPTLCASTLSAEAGGPAVGGLMRGGSMSGVRVGGSEFCAPPFGSSEVLSLVRSPLRAAGGSSRSQLC